LFNKAQIRYSLYFLNFAEINHFTMKSVLRFTFSLVLFSLISITEAQPFAIGHRQKSFTDASRNNRVITTEIYYPATTAGDNVTVSSGQFPILVFGHGFVMAWSAYDVVWNALVPNGYILVFPTTETSLSPSHGEFGKDIAYLVGAMKAEGQNSSSPFFNAVTNTSAVMGHSMGGGAAFLSVQHDPTITAIATLAAANTTPSAIQAAAGITIPALVLSGGNDCVTPPAQHQIPMYDSLISSCKSLVSITGGSHCQFANYNFNCYFGEGTCSPQATITPAVQQSTVASVLLPWLNYYLKNDCTAGTQFQNLLAAGSGITSQQNCTLACTATNENKLVQFSVAPNPVQRGTQFTISGKNLNTVSLEMRDASGKITPIKFYPTDKQISVSLNNISQGVYFVTVFSPEKTALSTFRIVVTE
jgi:pimeloyl-ACP methyl ester carboxylesterase